MTSESDEDESDDAIPIEAINGVLNAIKPLDRAMRKRVLEAVSTLLGTRTSATSAGALLAPTTNTTTSQPSAAGFFRADRNPSPKQFMIDKRPRTDVDRIACLAYYLTHYRDQPHFKTLDLSALNNEAAQLKFSNAAQAADNATRSGIIIPAGNGRKQLSGAGELYVQRLPDYETAKQSLEEHRQRPRRRS